MKNLVYMLGHPWYLRVPSVEKVKILEWYRKLVAIGGQSAGNPDKIGEVLRDYQPERLKAV
jgi:hypothetical protein